MFSVTNAHGRTYYLHKVTVNLINTDRKQVLYYFSAKVREDRVMDALPAGYEVGAAKNGLPVLKKTK